jgi:hypothetical protein
VRQKGHAHVQGLKLVSGDGKKETPREEVFGVPPRENPERPWGDDEKLIVSVPYEATYGLGCEFQMIQPNIGYFRG